MPTRLSTQERKAQIVLAALNLLSTVSVDCLTTRMVAGAIGVSQPALFKHFASRDAILHAVMDHVRSSLESSVKTVFSTAKGAHEVAQGLLEGLFRFAEAFPGAPRLLFYDAATSGNEAPPSLHAQLLLIVSRQATLVTDRRSVCLLAARRTSALASGLERALVVGPRTRDSRLLVGRAPRGPTAVGERVQLRSV
jgi:TetR/AcrR family transcriptional regulator